MIMKNSEKNNQAVEAPPVYDTPTIEVVEIEIESGFAQGASPPGGPGGGIGED
jgi:hypothetical protein